jgi:hypothetical protein
MKLSRRTSVAAHTAQKDFGDVWSTIYVHTTDTVRIELETANNQSYVIVGWL